MGLEHDSIIALFVIVQMGGYGGVVSHAGGDSGIGGGFGAVTSAASAAASAHYSLHQHHRPSQQPQQQHGKHVTSHVGSQHHHAAHAHSNHSLQQLFVDSAVNATVSAES